MLEDAGLDHDYIRLQRDSWVELKKKFQDEGAHSSTLPCIETSGQRFFKTVPIMRYISTKLGEKYHGSTPEENQHLEVVADVSDLWFEHMKNAFFGAPVS
jgi:hypothetical protein